MISSPPDKPTFFQLFTPKSVTVLREGYSFEALKADAVAGLTVAIVALPLSMAIAIASGSTPAAGLYTAIIGGFLVSALGGSRFQIGGPAGAFIVLVATTVQLHGLNGLILATMMSGVIMMAMGFLRLGTFIKYIPYPVTVGFTFGIAVVIFASQLSELFGLTLAGKEPGALIPKLEALASAWPTLNAASLSLTVASIAVILLVRRLRPMWPAFLIAVGLISVLSWWMQLPVATIGTRFGGIPQMLPAPHLPQFSVSAISAVLPAAISFALLGAIESLLSAVIADSMSGRRHRSNTELVAQGVANIASALFGGFCVTGTNARTATNVRVGARTPLSGMMHSLFILLFMVLAAPLASYIPLAALAAVLAVVAWNMAERREFMTLIRASWGDAVVLLVTFLLVVFRDLTEGIVVGFSIAALLFLHRMSQSVRIDNGLPAIDEDPVDGAAAPRTTYDASVAADPDVLVYRISGAFFFGSAASVASALDRIAAHPKAYVIDFSAVPMLDSTAAATIEGFVRKAKRNHAAVYLAGGSPSVQKVLVSHGVRPPHVHFAETLEHAIAKARAYAVQVNRPLSTP